MFSRYLLITEQNRIGIGPGFKLPEKEPGFFPVSHPGSYLTIPDS